MFDLHLRLMNRFCSSLLKQSMRRFRELLMRCGGALAPVRIYRSGIVEDPDRKDCISVSVLKRWQFLLILKLVNFGLGTNFRLRPRTLEILGGGGTNVQRL
jgi:hypothetical protein